MKDINTYLSKTESATIKIFEGIDSYLSILTEIDIPTFSSSTTDEEQFKEELLDWEKENEYAINQSIDKQKHYLDESIALSILNGSVLQIAAMGMQLCSTNEVVPDGFDIIKRDSKPAKFCIGRKIRNIPLGLIIYAGRNQYNHLDDMGLREPTKTIFEKLSQIEDDSEEKGFYIDPAFDINNPKLLSYLNNITALIGWRSYTAFKEDMLSMLE